MSYGGEMITEPQAEEGITHAEWLTPQEIARSSQTPFSRCLTC